MTRSPAPMAAPAHTQHAMGQPHPHESARAQVTGNASYIDDLPEVRGTLYAAPILSRIAHGQLHGVDASAALQLPGVRSVVLAADVPGDKLLAAFAHDEPVFAIDRVEYAAPAHTQPAMGQPHPHESARAQVTGNASTSSPPMQATMAPDSRTTR